MAGAPTLDPTRSTSAPGRRLEVVLGGLLLGCHPASRTVRVIASDYALQAPGTVRPGTTEFVLQNRGRVAHELILGLLRPGAGVREMVGAALTADLQRGRDYALLCQLRDTATSLQHAALGMVHVLHVR
jgi:hypothetical protein